MSWIRVSIMLNEALLTYPNLFLWLSCHMKSIHWTQPPHPLSKHDLIITFSPASLHLPGSWPRHCIRECSAVWPAPAWPSCRPWDTPPLSGSRPGGPPLPFGLQTSSGPRGSWTGPRSPPALRPSPGHSGQTIVSRWLLVRALHHVFMSPLLRCCWAHGSNIVKGNIL